MLLSAENITIQFIEGNLLNNVSLYINYKDKIGIIGSNGSGKSTILKIIAGIETSYHGNISKKEIDRIAYLPQDTNLDENLTILEYLQSQNKNIKADKTYELESILTKLGVSDFSRKIKHLSTGEKKRVMLASTLVKPCELLILDEPTNHLDIEMIQWLEKYLTKFNQAILLVTHDRYFLETVVNKIVEVEDGNLYSYDANYQKYLLEKLMQEEIKEASIRKQESFLRRELAWVNQGAQGRGTKDKRRLKRYEELSKQTTTSSQSLDLISISSRLGKKTIIFNGVSKKINNKFIIKDFTFILDHEDRIGIIGINGVGKSTLLNLFAGIIEPDKGIIETGETVNIGYYKQEVEAQNPKQRPIDYINEVAMYLNIDGESISSTKMLEQFLFTKEMQYSQIETLSGGEKKRLYLLKILMSAPNILLLDEPTNDLDLSTLSILEEYIDQFNGPVITVSHDRYFLDKTIAKIIEMTGDETNLYNGNYTEGYLVNKKEQLKIKKHKPKIIKEKTDKITFKEKQELSRMEDEIALLDNQLQQIVEEVKNNYHDYQKLAPLLEQQLSLENQIEEKFNRWEYLSTKIE